MVTPFIFDPPGLTPVPAVMRPAPAAIDPAYEPDRPVAYCPFTAQEIRQFDLDDIEAGRRIGKILASLFVYTLAAMAVVSVWTFQVVTAR